MGRPRKPTSLKLLEGTYRKDRAYNEPAPNGAERIEPPESFTDEQKELWNKYAHELAALGVLTNVDTMAFRIMMETYHQLQEVNEKIKEDGLYITDDRGNTRRNPLLSQANQLRQIIKQYLSEFGMTPSSRSKINLSEEATKDDFAESFGL